MNRIKDIMLIQDLFKLNKAILKDIAADLNIDTSLNKNELVMRIFSEEKISMLTLLQKLKVEYFQLRLLYLGTALEKD